MMGVGQAATKYQRSAFEHLGRATRNVSGYSVIVVAGFGLLSGCTDEKTEKHIAALETSLAQSQATTTALAKRVEVLEELSDPWESPALVSTDDSGYGLARTKHGVFMINVVRISEHLDGFKVRLAVGNMTTVQLRGAKVRVFWKGAAKPKEISTPTIFFPGTKSEFDVVLTPAKAEQVRVLRVGLEFDTVAF